MTQNEVRAALKMQREFINSRPAPKLPGIKPFDLFLLENKQRSQATLDDAMPEAVDKNAETVKQPELQIVDH